MQTKLYCLYRLSLEMENTMPQNGASLFLVFPDGFGLVILSLNIKRSQRQRIMRATVFFAAVV